MTEAVLWAVFILGLALVLINLFTSLTKREPKPYLSENSYLSKREFFAAVESITRSSVIELGRDEKIQVLSNGDEFLPDLLTEISKAEYSINITSYIWSRGNIVNTLLDALIEKAEQGIEVRLVSDGIGALTAPYERVKKLQAAGGKVAVFRPVRLYNLARLHRRNHSRAMVIDGKVAYTGGASFKEGWEGDGTEEDKWRDLMFKMTGRPAQSIQNMFSTLWRHTDGEILVGEKFYPPLPKLEFEENPPKYLPFFHLPSPDLDSDLSQLTWFSLALARHSIHIETPYLAPKREILEILKAKARSGVKVEIVVPSSLIDAFYVRATGRTYYRELLDAGVRIFEYQSSKLHSKVILVDERWSLFGSANLDIRSHFYDIQSVIGVDHSELAREIVEEINADKRESILITPNFKMGIIEYVLSWFTRTFVRQY